LGGGITDDHGADGGVAISDAGLGVGLVEIGEEAAAGIVAAVDFVEEIDALEMDVVVGRADDVGVVPEFLDVDDGDLGPAGMVVDGAGGLDVLADAGFEEPDDRLESGSLGKAFVESFAEVLVLEEERDFLKKPVDVVGRGVGGGFAAPALRVVASLGRGTRSPRIQDSSDSPDSW
jgi:hypothetical protein